MKIMVFVSTNRIGSKVERAVEIEDSELEDMDEHEKNEFIEVTAQQTMFEMIDWTWEPIE